MSARDERIDLVVAEAFVDFGYCVVCGFEPTESDRRNRVWQMLQHFREGDHRR
jgi:hypothetical protein